MKQKEITNEALLIASRAVVKNKMCKQNCQSCKACTLRLQQSISQEDFPSIKIKPNNHQ